MAMSMYGIRTIGCMHTSNTDRYMSPILRPDPVLLRLSSSLLVGLFSMDRMHACWVAWAPLGWSVQLLGKCKQHGPHSAIVNPNLTAWAVLQTIHVTSIKK